jgi:HSP20 family protein
MADPLKELLALKERVNRLFENALARSKFGEGPSLLGEWVPSANISEGPETLVVEAELPGFREQDIDVTITDHTLQISGDRRMGTDLQEGNYHRIERSYGNFSIDFPLHTPIDRDHVEATYKLGVLHVTLPKIGSDRSRQVKVKLN